MLGDFTREPSEFLEFTRGQQVNKVLPDTFHMVRCGCSNFLPPFLGENRPRATAVISARFPSHQSALSQSITLMG